MSESREKVTHKTRKVLVERASAGFGFVLRGAKADGPISEFTPCPTCPAVQYLESVDQSGPAWSAGLRPGDFIIEINGISVIRAGHRQAVELIRSTTGTLRLTATSVVTPKKTSDESRTATVKPRPQSRSYGPAELQDILNRQQLRGSETSSIRSSVQSSCSNDKPRIPKIPDAISFGSSTPSSVGIHQIRNSRSISPSPSTNSDNSSSSRNSEKTGDAKKKPPPPKRGQSRLVSTSDVHTRANSIADESSVGGTVGSSGRGSSNKSRHQSATSLPPLSPPPQSSSSTQSITTMTKTSSPTQNLTTTSREGSSTNSLNTFKSPEVECNSIESSVVTSSPPPPPPIASKPVTQQAAKSNSETQVKPDKPARPGHRNKDQNDQAELIKELSKSMNNRIPKTEEHEEVVQKKDYSNLNEIESELEEIQKKTKSTDPNSAFAIAMSAKHKTLTKRREKLKRNIPTAEEITQRLKGESSKDSNHKTNEVSRDELQYSSEESGTNEVMRRFLESPSKYPFDIPDPILDSGVETIGSNSTGSDREEAKHQQFLQLKQTLKAHSSVTTWSCVDVCDWLRDNGWGQYAMNFQENEIEGVHLATLTKDDLAELGVTKIGHKLSIMKLIEQVKSHVTV